MPEPLSTPRRLWLDPMIVIAISLLVLWPVLGTSYSPVDDFSMLRDNQMMNPPTWQGFWIQWTEPQFNIYSPLAFGTWYAIAGLTHAGKELPALGFKIASLLAHAGAAAAAWWVLWRIVRHRIAAVVGGLIVALHPLQVESLAWTTGLKDIYCGAFSFLTLGAYLLHLQTGKPRPRYWAIAFAVLATASKPTAMVLPAVLLCADWMLIERPWRERLYGVAPFVPISALCILIIVSIQAANTVDPAPLWMRPLVAADALAFYLWKVVVPWNLSVDYARLTVSIRQSGAMYWTWIFPVMVLAAVLASRSRPLILALGLLVIPLSPVLGLKPFDMQQYTMVADHYMYQSMLGVGLAGSLLIARVRVAGWAMAVGVIALAFLSWNRLRVWQDMDLLFAEAIRVSPRSVMARGCMAILAFQRDDIPLAERYSREAIAIRPHAIAYDNLATALQLQGRLEEAASFAKNGLAVDTDHIKVPRLRQLVQLAAIVRDRDLAKMAAIKWLAFEPNNPTPAGLLRVIEAEAATRPSTNPVTKP